MSLFNLFEFKFHLLPNGQFKIFDIFEMDVSAN
jgi:hypothetical protein